MSVSCPSALGTSSIVPIVGIHQAQDSTIAARRSRLVGVGTIPAMFGQSRRVAFGVLATSVEELVRRQ